MTAGLYPNGRTALVRASGHPIQGQAPPPPSSGNRSMIKTVWRDARWIGLTNLADEPATRLSTGSLCQTEGGMG